VEVLAHLKENHIPSKDCDYLIKFYKENCDKAVQWRNTFPLELEETLLETAKKYLEPTSLHLDNSIVDYSQVVYWPEDSYQDMHVDDAYKFTSITSISYLNDDFEGGHTYFEDGTQFAPVKGRTIFFDGQYFRHAVKRISGGKRFVLATWYKKPEKEAKQYWPFENFIKIKLNISETEKQQIKVMLQHFKDSNDPDQVSTFKVIDILGLPLLNNLRKQITEVLDKISLSLTNSWAQLYKKGDAHEPHIHPESEYSGVIYIDGKGEDGTSFIDTYSGKIHKEKFDLDTLILFPSKIIHFVNTQKKDDGRIIISFNTERKKC